MLSGITKCLKKTKADALAETILASLMNSCNQRDNAVVNTRHLIS